MKNKDIIIIGGGPSGAVLGRFLKENGVDNLIIERFERKRDKVCAGGVPVGIRRFLPEKLRNFKHVEYNKITISYKGGDIGSSTSKKNFMFGVVRREFDGFLRNGLDVHYNENFETFEKEKNGIIIKTNKNTYKSRFLIGADGVGSKVSILSNLAPKKRFIIAEEKEIPLKGGEDKKEIKIYLGYNFLGYGWVFPKEKVSSVGAGALQKYFKKGLSDNLVKNGAPKVYPIALWGGKEKLTDERIALIGEAGGLVDPFSAGGIYPAVLSAKLLAEVILENLRTGKTELSLYNDLLNKSLYSEFAYALSLSKMFYPFISIIKKHIIKENTLNLAVELASKGYISYKQFYQKVEKSRHLSVRTAYFIVKKFVK